MIFVGKGALLKSALQYTLQQQCTIDMVYCPGTELVPFLEQNQIPFRITAHINNEIAHLAQVATDQIVFSINNGWIFNREILALPGFRFYNIHNGPLPQYRGLPLVCIIYALLNNEAEYGVSLHCIEAGIDTGKCISIRKFPITATDHFESVMNKGLQLCQQIFCDNLHNILNGSVQVIDAPAAASRLYTSKDLEKLTAYRSHPNLERALHFGVYKLWYRQVYDHIQHSLRTTNEIKEIPVLIKDDTCALYGIMRMPEAYTSIVILTPALTGTRIGPQNIYVDISRQLAASGIACLCIEFPPAGDSYDIHKPTFPEDDMQRLYARYAYYLDKTCAHLTTHFPAARLMIGSISVGCLPVLAYCRSKGLEGAILLSPNHFGDKTAAVDTRNVKSYIYKAFRAHTWKKVFTLQVSYSKVIRNIIKPRKKKTAVPQKAAPAVTLPVKVLCIFGEKDAALKDNQAYWLAASRQWPQEYYNEQIINGADHSFFGWTFKQHVCNHIVQWTQKQIA